MFGCVDSAAFSGQADAGWTSFIKYKDKDLWMVFTLKSGAGDSVVWCEAAVTLSEEKPAFHLNKNDAVLWKADAANCSFLILLDLRAAFDTADHPI